MKISLEQTSAAKSVRILIIAANPYNSPGLAVEQEIRELLIIFRKACSRIFDINILWASQMRDIREGIIDFAPHCVHFSGHGYLGKFLVSNEDGECESYPLDMNVISELFSFLQFRDAVPISLVTFSSCASMESAVAFSQHVSHVIYSEKIIHVPLIIEFYSAFYYAFAQGCTVEQSYSIGCNAVRGISIPVRSDITSAEWPKNLIPKLLSAKLIENNRPNESHRICNNAQLEPKFCIAFAMASPVNLERINADIECREIYSVLKNAILKRLIRFDQWPAVRFEDLHLLLLNLNIEIFHFSGFCHVSSLCLENSSGTVDYINFDAIVNLFRLYNGNLRCVILNSSNTSTLSRRISAYVPYAIGYENSLSDREAILFSTGFYRAVVMGMNIENSYQAGMASLLSEANTKATPLLFSATIKIDL